MMVETAARRLEIALELADLAVELYESKIRREDPGLSNAEVQEAVAAWNRSRPGAENGDAEGCSVAWPRRGPVGE